MIGNTMQKGGQYLEENGKIIEEKGSKATIAAATKATSNIGHFVEMMGDFASKAATKVGHFREELVQPLKEVKEIAKKAWGNVGHGVYEEGYKEGEKVMYWSETNKGWMDATIGKVNREAGLVTSYDLNLGVVQIDGVDHDDIFEGADPAKIKSREDVVEDVTEPDE